MRITEKAVRTITAYTTQITGRAFDPKIGGGYGGAGFRVTHAGTGKSPAGLRVWSSAKGEAFQAAAYYLGVIEAYRETAGASSIPDELADIAAGVMARSSADEWHAEGKSAAEHVIKRAAEAADLADEAQAAEDKKIMKDETRPIEERRAAFRQHNRRGAAERITDGGRYTCVARPCKHYPRTEIAPNTGRWVDVETPKGREEGLKESRHADCVTQPGSWDADATPTAAPVA